MPSPLLWRHAIRNRTQIAGIHTEVFLVSRPSLPRKLAGQIQKGRSRYRETGVAWRGDGSIVLGLRPSRPRAWDVPAGSGRSLPPQTHRTSSGQVFRWCASIRVKHPPSTAIFPIRCGRRPRSSTIFGRSNRTRASPPAHRQRRDPHPIRERRGQSDARYANPAAGPIR